MIRWNAIILLAFLLSATTVQATWGQASWRAKVRQADKLYEEGQYDEALVKYMEALGQNGDSTFVKFGLGNVFQAQEKFQEAGQSFQTVLASPDSLIRADGFYNLGNALVGAQQYDKAVEAYKQALKLHPGQTDYLHNLELALHLVENPPPQQQQSPGGQNDEKQEEQQEQKQQDQQQQEQQQEQQRQEQQSQQEEKQQEEQQQQQPEQQAAQPDSMSREDAERLLNALQLDEKQVQENLHRKQAVEAGRGKDW